MILYLVDGFLMAERSNNNNHHQIYFLTEAMPDIRASIRSQDAKLARTTRGAERGPNWE